MSNDKVKFLSKRIGVIMLDYFVFSSGITIIALLIFGTTYLLINKQIEEPYSIWLIFGPLLLLFILFSFYLNKDAIEGKSPAKRILGLIIVNNKTLKIANPIRLVIRNITLILWPIEIIFTLFSPKRRIGDYLAGTKVIVDNKTLKQKRSFIQIIIAFFIGILISSIIVTLQILIQGYSIFDISF